MATGGLGTATSNGRRSPAPKQQAQRRCLGVRFSAGLDPHVRNSTSLGTGNACKQLKDERLKISEAIRGSA